MVKLGDSAKIHWPLEKDMIFLNHGSYGAAPFSVLSEQANIRARLEQQPCRFINIEAPKEIRSSASKLASYINAKSSNVVFVENTTSGINAVMKSIKLGAGDEIIITDHIYNAVRKTLEFVTQTVGARLVEIPIGLPIKSGEEITNKIAESITSKTKLLVVDHIASVSAIIFPIREILIKARKLGVLTLVDGAHAPGMLELNLEKLDFDWYIANCHKWLCSPKGAAFLVTRPAYQTTTHPTTISHDLGKGYTCEFDKIGTRDSSAWLTVPKAIEFCESLGGQKMRERNHRVAIKAAQKLCSRWGTELGAPKELFGSMITIRIPGELHASRETADKIKSFLWSNHRTEVHIMPFSNALWLRLSVHAYNTLDECLRVGPLIEKVIKKLG